MQRQNKRYLGDLDAASDSNFDNHFVESDDLRQIFTDESSIVYGSKGVGKTALRRALTEIEKDHYYTTVTIDLDRISFAEVHGALDKLKNTSGVEVLALASNTWRNVLALYCLDAVASQLGDDDGLKAAITDSISTEGLADPNAQNRILGFIDRVFQLVARAADDGPESTPLGLAPAQRRMINLFPLSPALMTVLEQGSKRVQGTSKVVLISLDGFDSIVVHTDESRRAVFAGLIDAIYKCSKDPLLNNAFCFKAFLPLELADDAHRLVWDADKFAMNRHVIRWSVHDFEDFLVKRLGPLSKTKRTHFLDVWHAHMPDKIRNNKYTLDEPSFGYILRHTLYRPRQVLTHLQSIFDQWDARFESLRVDPTFIPQVVSNTNYDLSEYVVGQVAVRMPEISNFMRSWRRSSNAVSVGECRERIGRMFGCETSEEIDKRFTALFNFGIFGVANHEDVYEGAPQSAFSFVYVGDRFQPHVCSAVSDSDIVALSPMFHEYCGATPSDYGVIIPSEV